MLADTDDNLLVATRSSGQRVVDLPGFNAVVQSGVPAAGNIARRFAGMRAVPCKTRVTSNSRRGKQIGPTGAPVPRL
jgi:hypothetical protein